MCANESHPRHYLAGCTWNRNIRPLARYYLPARYTLWTDTIRKTSSSCEDALAPVCRWLLRARHKTKLNNTFAVGNNNLQYFKVYTRFQRFKTFIIIIIIINNVYHRRRRCRIPCFLLYGNYYIIYYYHGIIIMKSTTTAALIIVYYNRICDG